jgi:hypothetical protein
MRLGSNWEAYSVLRRRRGWDTVTLAGSGLDYPQQVAQEGSRNIADVTKMMTLFGGNDQFIYPRAVINYYRVLAGRYQTDHDQTGFEGVQSFYRLFHATGVGHCGIPAGAFGPDASLGDIGPWPQSGLTLMPLLTGLSAALHRAKSSDRARGRLRSPSPARGARIPRPRSTSAAATSTTLPIGAAAGNLETLQVICPDILVRYKHEVNGNLDYRGSGVPPEECGPRDHDPGGEQDEE